jgi:hypothetical protein
MAINTVIEGNFLKIDNGVKIHYWNAAWVSIFFDATNVYLKYNSEDLLKVEWNRSNGPSPYQIPMADFTYDSVAYVTEAAIATILSDKIG